jgi:DNA transformation protein and related proteins
MDRDYLIDLFSEFGPVVLRRMFSGYGIVADGVNFAMALRAGIIFRVDDLTIARYEAEGAKPFQYDTRNKTVVVKSYRHLPERLYDDPEELAVWAREAVGAAKRAAAKKSSGKKGAAKQAAKPVPVKAGAGKAKPSAAKKATAKATKRTTKSEKIGPKRAPAKKR